LYVRVSLFCHRYTAYFTLKNEMISLSFTTFLYHKARPLAYCEENVKFM